MSSLTSVLNTGKQALIAQQTALSITGTNIANVNTKGYSRQTVQMEALSGGGVLVSDVGRLRDQFLEVRLRSSNARMQGSSTLATSLEQMEQALSESEDHGLSQSVQDFLTSLEDLSSNPSGVSERESVRSLGVQMASSFSGTASRLEQIRTDLDTQVGVQVDRVNAITGTLAELNKTIARLSNQDLDYQQRPEYNSMLDQRDTLIDELSGYLPLNIVKNDNGSLTIFGADEVLVEGANNRELTLQRDESNNGLHAVMIQKGTETVSLNGKLTSGSLGGLIQARDGQGSDIIDSLNRMAAEMIQEFNQVHQAGTGLDGQTGVDFFSGLAVSAAPALGNSNGTGVSATSIIDPSALTFDDYEIRFTSSSAYDVVDTTTNTVLSAGNAYTSGSVIGIDGMQVTLSDSAAGPVAGDTFALNSYDGTAGRMGLSAAVQQSTNAIAAGQTSSAGDNRNALEMTALFDSKVMGEGGNYTFEEYYDKVRLQLAMDIQVAKFAESDEDVSQQQINAMMDSISGVSIDEESTNIIQFQRSFQAASRMINAADDMMQTLINMI